MAAARLTTVLRHELHETGSIGPAERDSKRVVNPVEPRPGGQSPARGIDIGMKQTFESIVDVVAGLLDEAADLGFDAPDASGKVAASYAATTPSMVSPSTSKS